MSKTILVVDDEQVLRDSLVELLTDEGYDVAAAANGKEAHDLLLQFLLICECSLLLLRNACRGWQMLLEPPCSVGKTLLVAVHAPF